MNAKTARRALQILSSPQFGFDRDARSERGRHLENGAGIYRDPLQYRDIATPSGLAARTSQENGFSHFLQTTPACPVRCGKLMANGHAAVAESQTGSGHSVLTSVIVCTS